MMVTNALMLMVGIITFLVCSLAVFALADSNDDDSQQLAAWMGLIALLAMLVVSCAGKNLVWLTEKSADPHATTTPEKAP